MGLVYETTWLSPVQKRIWENPVYGEELSCTTPTRPNETLCSNQAATVSVVAEAGHQLSVPVLQADLTMESAAVPTECLPLKKDKNYLMQNILLWGMSYQT